MGTSKHRAPAPRRQKMVSIVVAGAVPLALVLGGTAIANVAATSATVTQSGYALPEPPPPHVPSPDEPLLEQPHPERQNPEQQNQPEQPPGEILPDQPAQ